MNTEAPKTRVLHVAHASLQSQDTKRETTADIRKIFGRDYAWITGTEAGQAPVLPALRLGAHDAGYQLSTYKSNFVAVNRKLIERGSFRKGGKTIVDNDRTKGRGHDLNFCWCRFDTKLFGEITLMSSHYPLLAKPYATPEKRVNLDEARELAEAIGEYADHVSRGSRLVFYGGDQNISDRKADTFFGEKLTSVWDELEKWADTGHGNIDVIASHDRDGRVEAKYVRAMDDTELFLNTDHYLVEAGFEVELLAS